MHFDSEFTLKTQNIDFAFEHLRSMISSNDIELMPVYKQGLVWDNNRKSKYIESALLGLPLQGFLFEESLTGMFSVVDGSQRLTAIIEYLHNEFRLSNLTVLEQNEGASFADLSYREQMHLRRAVCSVVILDWNSHPLLKCEYLKRINIGHPTFVPQQARNFAYPNAHNIVKDGGEYLSQYLNFRISDESHGIRKFNAILKKEQFFLSLVLITYLQENIDILDSNTLLGRIFDMLTEQLEDGSLLVNTAQIGKTIKLVLNEIKIDKPSLVHRSYSAIDQYRNGDISMNDFLAMFFQLSFGTSFVQERSRFDFFKEDIPIRRLRKYL